jgi:hypothetical protein
MQHYGAPTRLLDWTGSIFVAAYFAVAEEPDCDGAIWAIELGTLYAKTEERQAGWSTQVPNARVRRPISPGAPQLLGSVWPIMKTDRMGPQQTSFTMSNYATVDHADILDDIMPPATATGGTYAKLTIPAKKKLTFLRHLRRMNVTPATLFPGLDGQGRTVNDLVKIEAPAIVRRRGTAPAGQP